jgi:H+/Cl- antiporter ClcA
MSKGPRVVLTLLLVGTIACVVAIGLTVAWNWFFEGEAGITRDTLFRLILLCFVVVAMPLGLMWARSRNDKR